MISRTEYKLEELGEKEYKNFFGPLYDYLAIDDIIDVDYESNELWVTYSSGERKKFPEDERITQSFIESFTTRARNVISGQFSKADPWMETEYGNYRITFIHESVSPNGRTFCIRKVSKYPVHTAESLIETGYCSKEALNFIVNCVKAHMVIGIGALPDVGKTEILKFLTMHIPPEEKTITIEERQEIFMKGYMPDNDVISLLKSENMSGSDAIRTALCLNPKWLIYQEVRGSEANELITAWTTGIPGIVTFHGEEANKFPERITDMTGKKENESYILHEVYEFLDIGVQLRWKVNSDGERYRSMDQICLYNSDKKGNHATVIIDNGVLIKNRIPTDIWRKFERAGIKDPFRCEALDESFWPDVNVTEDTTGEKEVLLHYGT